MMENPNSSSMVDSTSSAPKRYTPPNQRNRSLNRRRSIGSFSSNEGERSQPVSVAVAVGFQKENSSSPKIISLAGCSNSEAFHLLSDRWAAAMHLYSDPTVDLSGGTKPINPDIGFSKQAINVANRLQNRTQSWIGWFQGR